MWIPIGIALGIIAFVHSVTKPSGKVLDPQLFAMDRDGDGIDDEFYYKDKQISKETYDRLMKMIGG